MLVLPWALRIPALLLLGWGLAFCFCAMQHAAIASRLRPGRSLQWTRCAWWGGVLELLQRRFLYAATTTLASPHTPTSPALDRLSSKGGTPSCSAVAYGS